MPITINGSGTVTGITAGGLPDAIITQPELAANVAGNGPAFSAYKNVQQTGITSGVATKLTFQAEEFDTNSNYDTTTSRFTPTVAGYYQINSSITGDPNNSTAFIKANVFKNGSSYKEGVTSLGINYQYPQSMVSALVYLNGSTDYVEIYALGSNSGGSYLVRETAPLTYFQAFLARAA